MHKPTSSKVLVVLLLGQLGLVCKSQFGKECSVKLNIQVFVFIGLVNELKSTRFTFFLVFLFGKIK